MSVDTVNNVDELEKEDDVGVLGNEFFKSFEVEPDSGKTDARNGEPDQIAIVGFWKPDQQSNKYECYSTLTITSPVKKPAYSDESAIFCEVLFTGDDGNVFFFYRGVGR
jgi:hypothetical protein